MTGITANVEATINLVYRSSVFGISGRTIFVTFEKLELFYY